MPTLVEPSVSISGVLLARLAAVPDSRGFFLETYRRAWLPGREMVQGNLSFSNAGVLRGLHYHLRQADFWLVPVGEVTAVLYDLREGSPTRGAHQRVPLGGEHRTGLYIPPGVAHGFFAHRDSFMTYLVDEYYDGTDELGVLWNDPALGIDWGVAEPVVSERDRRNPRLAELPPALRPRARG